MFRLPVASRLEAWRNFRRSLDELEFEQALARTAEFWTPAPHKAYYLDPDDVESWPDPWTLVEENYYCDLAKSLAMLYTVYLTNHRNSIEYEIRVYKDPDTGVLYHIAYLCQGKYILNLVDSEVVNNTSINKKFKLVRCYDSSKLNLEKY